MVLEEEGSLCNQIVADSREMGTIIAETQNMNAREEAAIEVNLEPTNILVE